MKNAYNKIHYAICKIQDINMMCPYGLQWSEIRRVKMDSSKAKHKKTEI